MIKNILFSLITKGSVGLINFLILIVSSRYLGVSSRGEISIFILNITIIQVINEIYTGYSIVHFIPKYNFKKMLVAGIIYSLHFITLSNAIIIFLNKQVSGYEWLGYAISLLVILNTFNCVLILGKENIKIYNLLYFIQPLALLLGLCFFIFGLKVYTFDAYCYPLLFSFAIAIIISSVKVFTLSLQKERNAEFNAGNILVKGFMYQAAMLMYVFANRYSYYLLPEKAKVGLYSSATSLMESVLLLSGAITPVLLARVANQSDNSKSAQITLILSKASFLFSLIAILILLMLPDSFFILVLGKGFAGIREIMLLYSPGILMASVFNVLSNFYFATGKQKTVLINYSLGFVTTLLFTPFLIGKYDVQGAAYAANLSYSVMAIGICSSFIISNKCSYRQLLSISGDYKIIRELFPRRR